MFSRELNTFRFIGYLFFPDKNEWCALVILTCRIVPDDLAKLFIIKSHIIAFSENVAECIGAGMNGHIAKPIDIKHVVKELKKVLVRRNGS